MKKLLALIFALCCGIDSSAVCPEQIRGFYSAYMCNFLHPGGDAKNRELCETHMTKGLIRRLQHTARETGADAVIRAQDLNEHAVASLTVRALGEGWFSITYYWNKEDKKPVAEIRLKAVDSGDTFKIVEFAQ